MRVHCVSYVALGIIPFVINIVALKFLSDVAELTVEFARRFTLVLVNYLLLVFPT